MACCRYRFFFFFYELIFLQRSSAILIISFLKAFFSFTLVSFFLLICEYRAVFLFFIQNHLLLAFSCFPIHLFLFITFHLFFFILFLLFFVLVLFSFFIPFFSLFPILFCFFMLSKPFEIFFLQLFSFIQQLIYLSFLYNAFSFVFSSTRPFFDYFLSFITSSTSCLYPFLPSPIIFFLFTLTFFQFY